MVLVKIPYKARYERDFHEIYLTLTDENDTLWALS